METTRTVASAGSALRKAHKLRVRQPLAALTVAVAGGKDLAGTFESIIADELNIKAVELLDAAEVAPADFGISQQLKVNARAAGPRLGKQVQVAIKASKIGDWKVTEDGTLVVGADNMVLEPGEYELETVVAETDGAAERAVSVLPGGGFLVLDTTLTDELRAEGTARDAVRAIQSERKDAGLNVADRIELTITAPAADLEALKKHEELVAGETLAVAVTYLEGAEFSATVKKA